MPATIASLPTIYKTRQMFDLEAKYKGLDIRFVLINLYNTLGSQAAVAKELGVSQPTIQNWFDMLGLKVVTTSTVVLNGESLAA